jgi:pimeloyl-ACP methyl ester carboxylesterase
MRTSGKPRRWIWLVLASLPTLFFFDALTGLVYRTDTTAHVAIIAPRSGSARRAIVVFPGYVMPGDTLGRAFAPFVAQDDALVVVDYADRGVNVSQISDETLAALNTLKPRELLVYGASMGGMLSKLFLDRYREAGAPYGRATLVLDSAPASWINIKRPSFLFDMSCWYRGGLLSSAIWACFSELGPNPPLARDASPNIVRAARRAGAWAGVPALTSQACFIEAFAPLRDRELNDIAQRVVFLQGVHPNDDPLIRISDAIAGWRLAFPNLTVITVEGRDGRWHLPLVEYPHTTVRAILSSARS